MSFRLINNSEFLLLWHVTISWITMMFSGVCVASTSTDFCVKHFHCYLGSKAQVCPLPVAKLVGKT